jgi:hypothetical protein
MPQRFESNIFSPDANKLMREAFEAAWLKATLIEGDRELTDTPAVGERDHRPRQCRGVESRKDCHRCPCDVGSRSEYLALAALVNFAGDMSHFAARGGKHRKSGRNVQLRT